MILNISVFLMTLVIGTSSFAQLSFEKGKCVFEGRIYSSDNNKYNFIFNEGRGQSETIFVVDQKSKIYSSLAKFDKKTVLAVVEFEEVILGNGQSVLIHKIVEVSGNPKTYITMKEISQVCKSK